MIGQRVPRPAAGLPHDQRRRRDLGQPQRPAAARPGVTGRGHHEQFVVADMLRDQVRRQMRGLDEAEPGLAVADQLEHAGRVGDGELDDGGRVARRVLGRVRPDIDVRVAALRGVACPLAGLRAAGLLDGAELDQPVRYQMLGDRLTGGDGEPVRHPGPDRAQAGLEAVGGVEHVLRPADHEPALLGEVRPRRRPGEQRHPRRPLQGPHPRRQRLLGDAEHRRGGGDRPLPAHLAQRPQRPQVVHGLGHRLQA